MRSTAASESQASASISGGGAHFDASEEFARHMDAEDPLRRFREQFHIPRDNAGREKSYFAGNSLGLQPKSARSIIEQELTDWANLAVDAHFHGANPWYSYHEAVRPQGERLVGAKPGANEVVMMNSLTVNLHLMMASFYQPRGQRTKILIDEPCFPSDIYAVKTHLRSRRLDPREHLIIARPRDGEHALRTGDVEAMLDREGESIALALLAGVNFFTGQAMDIPRITAAGQHRGCVMGWDLAHAAGNIELRLHEWSVDFACWCSYKYLNAGPGAVAGCFVHERHGRKALDELPRYGGWWGNDPSTRFKMHLQPEFVPVRGADSWQLSNPPILAMAPLRASLDIFEEAGMAALRRKSLLLTAYLRFLLEGAQRAGSCRSDANAWEIITPREPEAHGCQLSILVKDRPHDRFKAIEAAGIVCDFREPNVIRAAPVPLYNTFLDVWRFAQAASQIA